MILLSAMSTLGDFIVISNSDSPLNTISQFRISIIGAFFIVDLAGIEPATPLL